jgi:glucosylceramidase
MSLLSAASIRSFTRIALLSSLSLYAVTPANTQEVHLVVSSKAGDRLTSKPSMYFQKSGTVSGRLIEIHSNVHYQKMDGFGASFLEAGLICINSLPPKEQEAVLRSLFDPTIGAGFSAMKTVIASTDFMSAGPFYTYDETPGDVEMKHFSISRDLGPNGLITYIKRARRYGKFVLQAPMDYPPDWMLFDVNNRQDVNPKYYDALSLYYLRYLQEYAKNGVFINYLSLFNEPGNYTKIPYNEIGELLRDHVGPLLKRAGTRTEIMPSEAPTRENASRNYPMVLDDPVARKYIAVVPYHGYDFNNYDKIAAIHRQYPQFPLWMTEICYAHEGTETPKSMRLPRYDFDDGDFWGNVIFGDLEASASAWIYWTMVLNERGGPWSVSVIHGNPDPNEQQPVVIIDRQTKKVTYTGLYYYLAHFSKFVRPGSVRLQTVGSGGGVHAMSFKSPDGKIVTELMNSNKSATQLDLAFHGRILHLELPAISMTTAIWVNTGPRPSSTGRSVGQILAPQL